MWKQILFVSVLSLALLAGCNTNKDKLNEETPMQDVENGVNDTMRDTRDAIDDTVDAVDPNRPGRVDEGVIENGNGAVTPNVENGTVAPGAPSVQEENIIENSRDKKPE